MTPIIYTTTLKESIKKWKQDGYTGEEMIQFILTACDLLEQSEMRNHP
jgi:hypothetical protein